RHEPPLRVRQLLGNHVGVVEDVTQPEHDPGAGLAGPPEPLGELATDAERAAVDDDDVGSDPLDGGQEGPAAVLDRVVEAAADAAVAADRQLDERRLPDD